MIKTVSLETAKLLKEAGWNIPTGFLWRFDKEEENDFILNDATCGDEEFYYALTTDELLEELPSTIDKTPIGSIGKCFLEIVKWDDGYYYSAYYNPKIHTSSCELIGYRDKEVVETLAQLWLWLKKSNLLSGRG